VIERVVKSTYWDLDGRTEVVFKDDSTLRGETVEVVSKLRRYGSKVMMMRIRVS
jgi:glutamine phosphoribosylpyrophosphate amidotransferase